MSLKEKIEKYEFLLDDAPIILDMNEREVFVNKEAPNPNELASFEDYNSYWEGARVLTQKLKVESYGSWELGIAAINAKYFENRQALDRIYLSQYGTEADINQIGKIPIQYAISCCRVEISCNMKFYLDHPNEIEKDLNRSVDICTIKDDIDALKRLEDELFYNQMCRLFGDDDGDILEDENDQNKNNDKFNKVCTIKEFAILFIDGNCVFATGRRGDNYLLFSYVY